MRAIVNPLQIRKRMQEYAGRPTPQEWPVRREGETDADYTSRARKTRHALRGHISKALKEKFHGQEQEQLDNLRYLLYGWLFIPNDEMLTFMRSGDLTPQQWHALWEWVGPRQVFNPDTWENKWAADPAFTTELGQVLAVAQLHEDWTDQALERGEGLTMLDCIEHWQAETRPVKMEPGGMVQDTVSNLGGVVTGYVEREEQIKQELGFDPKPAEPVKPVRPAPKPVVQATDRPASQQGEQEDDWWATL